MSSTASPVDSNGGKASTKNPKGLSLALPSRPSKATPAGTAGGTVAAAGAASAQPSQAAGAGPETSLVNGSSAPTAGSSGSQIRPFLAPRPSQPKAIGGASGTTATPGASGSGSEASQQQRRPSATITGSGASSSGGGGPPSKPAAAGAGARAAIVARSGPSLPQRLPASSSVGVIDPEEPEATQKLRMKLHGIRVNLIRAAKRLGYDHDNGIVKQVLYRFYLAEKLKEPFRKGVRRPDPAALAAREALRLEESEAPNSPLGLRIRILVMGLAGTGKTQLIRSLLGGPLAGGTEEQGREGGGGAAAAVDAFCGATKRVEVIEGRVQGIDLTMIDTPGLHPAGPEYRPNAAALKAVTNAFRHHKPDLVVYVDRFDQPSRSGAEMPVLQAITNALGPGVWLNTVVALTHAGAPPPAGRGGQMSYNAYAQQRNHLLQLIIRNASGDARLMNPMTFAESHPDCRRNAQGHMVIPNGLLWQQHLLLLVASAKLLAEAEAAMQGGADAADGGGAAASGGGGAREAAARRYQAMMGAPQLPSRYLMQSLTQFSGPLQYPDHGAVMEVRQAQHSLSKVRNPKERKERARQIKLRLLQMSQLMKRQQRIVDMQTKATKAGAKMVPEQPRTANKTRPGVSPAPGWRYRVPEPGSGWIVRPHLEPHGMDDSDGVEGFVAEKAGVARRRPSDQLGGVPFRVSGSAQATKEQVLMSARADAAVYHDAPGLATTALSLDVQTSGAAGTPDLLVMMRADCQRRGAPLRCNTPAVGVMAARLARRCRLGRGPLALGLRAQDSLSFGHGPGGQPVNMDVAVARVFTRSDTSGPPGSLGAPGAPDESLDGDYPLDQSWRSLWGANAEVRTDARRALCCRRVAPLSVSGSAVVDEGGELVAAVAAGLRVVTGAKSGVGAKVQVNNRGFCNASLQLRSNSSTHLGLVGLYPLATLLWECAGAALERRRHQGQRRAQAQQQQKKQRQRQRQQHRRAAAEAQEQEQEQEQGQQQQQRGSSSGGGAGSSRGGRSGGGT